LILSIRNTPVDRGSILSSGGCENETQSEFLVLVEDAKLQVDLAKSVQRYQLALNEAKVRSNFAVCTGTRPKPARMVITTEGAVGYNNQLQQAGLVMKLWINHEVNTSTKKKTKK